MTWIFFEDLDIFEFSDGLDELENLEFEDDFDDSDDLVVGWFTLDMSLRTWVLCVHMLTGISMYWGTHACTYVYVGS